MKRSILLKVLLIISGVIGIWIGSALLFTPAAFEASAGIQLGTDVNLLSEIRAPSGLLLIGGMVILLGAFISKLKYTALLLSTLIFLSYALSRVVGVLFDGFPSNPLLIALVAELLIGLLSLVAFIRFIRQPYDQNSQG